MYKLGAFAGIGRMIKHYRQEVGAKKKRCRETEYLLNLGGYKKNEEKQ